MSMFVATDAEAYESYVGRWSRRLAPLFGAFAGVTADERVLDVGCGTVAAYVSQKQQPAATKHLIVDNALEHSG